MTATSQTAPTSKVPDAVAADRRSNRVEPVYYAMLLPVVILFTLFITFPALVGMFYSITNYAGYGDWQFVGLTNYTTIFSDPRILGAYTFTLGFAFVTVIVVNVIALALAIGLNAKIKFKKGLRGVFVIPMVISGIVIAYVFNYLFSTSLPMIAANLGITPLASSILANERFAWLAIVIVTAGKRSRDP
jgi:raffinose/stachyose/melibiose transport system permease protein